MNAVVTKAPLGLLIAWMRDSHDNPTAARNLDHSTHLRDRRRLSQVDALPERQSARDWLRAQTGPEWDALRALEGGRRTGASEDILGEK